MLTFNYLAAYPLAHAGDCGFIGITPSGQLFVEEFYGDDRLAQHHLDENGQMLRSVEEGTDENFEPLPLPELFSPQSPVKRALSLNHIGARYRGLREAERLSDLVQPLSVMEKMPLLQKLALNIPPMMLAGIAESRVLSEASLDDADYLMVCRRVLLAVVLPEQRIDDDRLPYDYETITLHIAHIYDAYTDSQPELHEALDGIGGVALKRPLECLTHHHRLYIAEGGDESAGVISRIHIWEIHRDG